MLYYDTYHGNQIAETKYLVATTSSDFKFTNYTQPLCIMNRTELEKVSLETTSCYIQDNFALTTPHPVREIKRTYRNGHGVQLPVDFVAMKENDDYLELRLEPGYCHDFPETYQHNNNLFNPFVTCQQTGGNGWFVYGSLYQSYNARRVLKFF